MPVYEYMCDKHHVTTELRPIDGRLPPTICSSCGRVAVKTILSAPRVFGDFEGYESPASGRWIEGKRQREEDFKRTGCRAYEPGDHAVAERNRVAREVKREAAIDDAIMKTAGELGIPTT